MLAARNYQRHSLRMHPALSRRRSPLCRRESWTNVAVGVKGPTGDWTPSMSSASTRPVRGRSASPVQSDESDPTLVIPSYAPLVLAGLIREQHPDSRVWHRWRPHARTGHYRHALQRELLAVPLPLTTSSHLAEGAPLAY